MGKIPYLRNAHAVESAANINDISDDQWIMQKCKRSFPQSAVRDIVVAT